VPSWSSWPSVLPIIWYFANSLDSFIQQAWHMASWHFQVSNPTSISCYQVVSRAQPPSWRRTLSILWIDCIYCQVVFWVVAPCSVVVNMEVRYPIPTLYTAQRPRNPQISQCRGSIDFRAKQINFEVVLEIRECAWSAKTVDTRIWNHVSNTTTVTRIQDKFETSSTVNIGHAHQLVRTLLLWCYSSSHDRRRNV